jgi:hypothetical protein
MKRLLRTGLVLAFLISTFSPIRASAATTDCTISSNTYCKVTFSFTGATENFIVPAGVTTIEIELAGAQGGSGNSSGGLGGYVKGTLSVTGGSTIYVNVGGQNGWNGGGAAGTGGSATNLSFVGGGASDIRIGGTALTDRKAVGGGGGGAGRKDCSTQAGGGGGYPGGLGGKGSGSKTGGDGTLTAGGSVSGNANSTGNCDFSPSGGGGGGQNGGGASGSYGVAAGGTSGNCGAVNAEQAGAITGFSGGCFGTGGNGGSNSNSGGGGGGGGWYGGGAGGANWASGGGGGSSYLGLMTSTSYTNATRSGNGYATITYLNTPTPTTFSTTQSSPTNISTSGTISYSLVLSQSVSDLATGDFQLGGTSTCNTPGLSGSGTTYTVTLTNCTEGTVILQLKANSVTGTSTGPPAVSSANTVVIDRTAPTISSVSAPSNSTYLPSNALNFTVNFSESVTVTGSPRLTLTVGSLTRYATFVSLTDSKTATFRYTVATASGEFDTDGIAVSTTLDLNSGTIADLASNALSPLTFSAPTLTSVLVAQTPAAPTITSITSSSGTLSVAFTAGATNGSAISNYQYSTDNGANWTVRSPVATTSPISISGLTNGTAYNVRIRAVNAAGAGDSSTAVSATPSAVVVSGDSTLTSTYGQAASTGTYTSSGGTGPYTYTLSASATGVSISGGVVTASASTPAGTYVRNVVSTDSAGTPQSGTRQLTITINKASTTITISLPGGASDAALGGAVTITANVSQAGSVNFRLGGTTISGCGTVASSGGTATCSWTPGALGGASLTAVLTPTDSSNYESATTSTLSITVVNGVTSLSLSLAGGVTQVPKGQNIVITATVDQAGRISFFVDGKRIAGCFNRVVATSSRTCTWKPSVQKQVTISARLVPTNSAYSTADESMKVWVVRRTGTR